MSAVAEKAADEILSLIKQKTVSVVVPIPTRRQILKRVNVAIKARDAEWMKMLSDGARRNAAPEPSAAEENDG